MTSVFFLWWAELERAFLTFPWSEAALLSCSGTRTEVSGFYEGFSLFLNLANLKNEKNEKWPKIIRRQREERGLPVWCLTASLGLEGMSTLWFLRQWEDRGAILHRGPAYTSAHLGAGWLAQSVLSTFGRSRDVVVNGQKSGLWEPAVYVPPRVDPIFHLSMGLAAIFSVIWGLCWQMVLMWYYSCFGFAGGSALSPQCIVNILAKSFSVIFGQYRHDLVYALGSRNNLLVPSSIQQYMHMMLVAPLNWR